MKRTSSLSRDVSKERISIVDKPAFITNRFFLSSIELLLSFRKIFTKE
jgi:hypothetical protein